jgi:hypothetical protein
LNSIGFSIPPVSCQPSYGWCPAASSGGKKNDKFGELFARRDGGLHTGHVACGLVVVARRSWGRGLDRDRGKSARVTALVKSDNQRAVGGSCGAGWCGAPASAASPLAAVDFKIVQHLLFRECLRTSPEAMALPLMIATSRTCAPATNCFMAHYLGADRNLDAAQICVAPICCPQRSRISSQRCIRGFYPACAVEAVVPPICV